MPDQKSVRSLRSQAAMRAPAPPNAEDSYWRSFPTLEKLLQPEPPPILDRIKATCRRLESVLASGSEQEKARARDVTVAYRRALELHEDLVRRRDTIFAQARNCSKAPHDK